MVKVFRNKAGEKLLLESYDRLLQAWDVPYKEQFISTRYGQTQVITAGNKSNPPLLLFHGIGDNSALMWFHNARELAAHFYIVAVDAPGAPGKSKPNEQYAKAFDSTLWIDDLLDALKLDRTHMAGVSQGVTFILQYAIHRPERVLRLIGMSGAFPVKGHVSKLQIIKSLTVFFPEMFFPGEKAAIRLLRKLSGPHFNPARDHELLIHFVYMLKYSIPPKRKPVEFDPAELARLKDKLYVMIGKCDPIAYIPSMLRFLEQYQFTYKIVEDAGHTMNDEKATLINREIIDFLIESEPLRIAD